MNQPAMNNNEWTERDSRQYWRLVQLCIVEFHDKTEQEALDIITNYRALLKEAGPKVEEIVYHDEPYNLAYDLVGSKAYQLDSMDALMYDLLVAQVVSEPL